MPIYIKEHHGNVNNYEHCTFYNGVPQSAQPQRREVEDVVPIEEQEPTATAEPAPEPNLEKFRSLLTIPYLNRKRECDAMLELITQDGWNKKDRARFALALYESGNVALKREHITSFAQWWRICCQLLVWDGADSCYKESQLTPNEATSQIKMYL